MYSKLEKYIDDNFDKSMFNIREDMQIEMSDKTKNYMKYHRKIFFEKNKKNI